MKIFHRMLSFILALVTVVSVLIIPSAGASASSAEDGVLIFDSQAIVDKFVKNTNGVKYSYDSKEGALKVEVTGNDPYFYVEWYSTVKNKLRADNVDYVYTVYKAPRTNSSTARNSKVGLYLCTDLCVSPAGRNLKEHTLISANGFVTSRTDVGGLKYYNNFGGYFRGVRVDVFQSASVGDVMYIDSIILNTPANNGTVVSGLRSQAKNGYPVDLSTDLIAPSYDVSKYTSPYWKGNIVYNEAVSPIQNSDGSYTYQLMYTPDEIIAVYDGCFNVYYKEGVDFKVSGNKLTILPGGSIDTFLLSDIQNWNYEGDRVFFQSYLNVTYKHSDTWDYYLPANKASKLPVTSDAIKNNKNLNVVFFGDSITGGANASSYRGYYPDAPYWWEQIADALRENYGFSNLKVYDVAEGGSTASGMVGTFKNSVLPKNPDLIFIEFGVNDAQNGETNGFKKAIKTMIDAARAKNPNCEIVLVSPFYSHIYNYSDYGFEVCQKACLDLEKEYTGVVCADVTAMHKSLREVKRHYDITGDNVCHPNDYFSRIYAQVCLATIIPEELGYEAYVPKPDAPVLQAVEVVLPESGIAPIPMGGKLDVSGVSLNLIYDKSEANTTVAVDPTWVSGFDSNSAGEKTVTVTYEGFTVQFTVTVYDPVIPGDVDGDGEITMVDLFNLKLFIKQKDVPTAEELRAADIDGDGEITMVDSFEIKYRVTKGYWRQ
ncbi:MAG: bacterial Ig-like domain-containing protein [Clostridia bacterium]|nr:bacterial Ig-like domain-containing protein [Clostridia bacterium]